MKIDVEHIASLARLCLSEEEKERFGLQLGSILGYVENLKGVDTADTEALSGMFAAQNILREDMLSPSLPTDDALRNAPDRAGNFFRVPKIIE